MKSVKLGRGPSLFNGVGSIVAIIFGIFWTFLAASIGAPVFFIFFGIVFIFLGIAQAIYYFINATSKNRFSLFDITEDEEDPLEENINKKKGKTNYCPKCGERVQSGDSFCKNCGKKLK